jgi:hypothetical protein
MNEHMVVTTGEAGPRRDIVAKWPMLVLMLVPTVPVL